MCPQPGADADACHIASMPITAQHAPGDQSHVGPGDDRNDRGHDSKADELWINDH